MEVTDRLCIKELTHPLHGPILKLGKTYTTLKKMTFGKIHVMSNKYWFWVDENHFKKLEVTPSQNLT